jgi:hypothetical protein
MIVVLFTVGAVVAAAIVATVRTIATDGYRRIPNTPIARRPELVR